MTWLGLLLAVIAIFLASGAAGRLLGGKRRAAAPKSPQCPWKLRLRAQNGFAARWRCARCNADVSGPEDQPPTRCHRIGGAN